jgi:hypothetical protein
MREMRKRATRTAKSVILVASAFFFGMVSSALAQGNGTNGISLLPNPLSADNFQELVASITNFLLLIAVPLTAIMALVGGFQMIMSGGNPEKFASGRKTLMYAAIGFAVVVIAGGVAQIVKSIL